MRQTFSRIRLRISVSLALLLMGAVALIGSSVPHVSSWTRTNPRGAVKAAAANTPYIKLQESRDLDAVYTDASAGKMSLQSASAHASVLPGQA